MIQEEIQERNKNVGLMLNNKFKIEFDAVYYSNWNMLIEAVEFIEKQNMQVSIIENECVIIDNEKALAETNPFMIEPICACYTSESKKEATFIAVSDFAKLYNEKKI